MSKPDWRDAPEWANFLAQDLDGRWNFYSSKPAISWPMNSPFVSEWSPLMDDKWWGRPDYEVTFPGQANANWRDTLEPRP
jgi:hypothetical protein